MLYVHLSNDQKLLALVLALGLFLVSLVLSVCLICTYCPLNRWLTRRAHSKRHKRQSVAHLPNSVLVGPQQFHQNLQHYHHNHHHHHNAAANYFLHKHPLGSTERLPRRGPIILIDKPPPAYDAVCSKPPTFTGRNPFLEELAQDTLRNKPPDSEPASLDTSSTEKQQQELDFGDYFHQPCEPGALAHEPHLTIPIPASIGSSFNHQSMTTIKPNQEQQQQTSSKLPIMLRLWAQTIEPDKLQKLMEHSQVEEEQQQKPALSRLSRQLSIPQLFGSIVSLTSGTPISSSSSATGTEPAEKQRPLSSTKSELVSTINYPPPQPPTTLPLASDNPYKPGDFSKPLACRVLHTNVASFSYLSDLELSADRKRLEASSESCQLLVGICDIENLLNTSWQLDRSCAHLTSSSAIYVQCELLASRPSRTRLLRHPLRALQAAAACPMAGKWAAYESTTDGKCVLVFTSQPRQVELALAGSAAAEAHLDRTDVIAFNSVFVGPPMSKKALEGARLSVRLYSRSRYLNETCLAELNLPLKRLLGVVDPTAGLSQDNFNTEAADTTTSSTVMQTDENSLKQLITHLLPTNGSPATDQPAKKSPVAALSTTTTTTTLSPYCKANEPSSLRNSCSADAALCRLATCAFRGEQQPEWAAEEQLYWRSLMAAHWLNQMPTSVHECQSVLERRADLVLGLSYLPTSNRVIFNAHKAQIMESSAPAQSLVKELRIHTGTCYLLRFLMVVGGRVVRRKQTPAASKPEWDGQEPITFDLASVGVATPVFLVLLVLCQPTTGSGRKLRRVCASHSGSSPIYSNNEDAPYSAGAQSEPESSTSGPNSTCALCRQGRSSRLELVLGHTILASETWRELRAQPRRQLVSQLPMY